MGFLGFLKKQFSVQKKVTAVEVVLDEFPAWINSMREDVLNEVGRRIVCRQGKSEGGKRRAVH